MKTFARAEIVKEVVSEFIVSQTDRQTAAPLITCLIPVYNEADNLPSLIPTLCEQLALLSARYEVLLVDDGSRDNSVQVAKDLSVNYPVRLLQLSRNFGKENALTAGIDHAQGDLLLMMDADLQHPLSMLPRFFALWQQGYDMVYGIRANRCDESFCKRRFTCWFYKLLKYGSEVTIEPDAGDFRLLDRRVVEALRKLPERNRFMKGLYGWVGFKAIGIPFNVEKRLEGQSRFSLTELVKLAITGITSFTTFPLHIWSVIGISISLLSMLYGSYIAAKTLIFGIELPGWATLTVAVTFLGGVQLLSIGVLGEYIAKIFTEVKARPPYLIDSRHDYDDLDTERQP